ncbi:hypothetical protein [Sphingomonas sp. Leaf242]|uniref:hypothetical protein n=1 Tax=Sphingomonas sp. Leaf242 TaxID=1736304 RepID=UPI000714A38D|nr:hypothetical protein [Sphingomonas sp. Leaf242]KQO06813.1 hypothetical protein ASF09_11090 [Sphingomonas sp. Leaf242]
MPVLAILAVQSGHSGVVHPRTGPEMSDIALFGFAAIGVWLVRRALRKRFIKSRRRDAGPPKKD